MRKHRDLISEFLHTFSEDCYSFQRNFKVQQNLSYNGDELSNIFFLCLIPTAKITITAQWRELPACDKIVSEPFCRNQEDPIRQKQSRNNKISDKREKERTGLQSIVLSLLVETFSFRWLGKRLTLVVGLQNLASSTL